MTTDCIAAANRQTQSAGQTIAGKAQDVIDLSAQLQADQARRHTEAEADVLAFARQQISEARKMLRHLGDMVHAYYPVHGLRRGFWMTLNARGKVIKSAADHAPGEMITTRLATGRVVSTITRTTRKERSR